MANSRKIIISRSKKFTGCLWDMLVYVDGVKYGKIANGQTVSCVLDSNAHMLIFTYNYGKGVTQSEPISVPANDLDYHYDVGLKNGLTHAYIVVSENPIQASKNADIIAERRKNYDIKNRVDTLLKKIENEKHPLYGRDYTQLRQLPPYCLQSNYFKQYVQNKRSAMYKGIAINYFGEGMDMYICYTWLREMAELCMVDKSKFPSLAHYNYMIEKNNIINSVLSEDVVSDLKKIEARDNMDSLPQKFFLANPDGEELYKAGKYEEAVNCILYTQFPDDTLNLLKKWLIFAAMVEGTDEESASFYRVLWIAYVKAFGRYLISNNKQILCWNVDMIIAEAIRLSRTNSIGNINKDLERFFEITAPIYRVENSQYDILQKVFAYLNAYEQEIIVLEAMVKNKISRSQEQEERLAFLKSSGNKKLSGSNAFRSAQTLEQHSFLDTIHNGENRLIYEYRTISWNENEIRDFFTSLSAQNQTTQLPFVVNEWNKRVTSQNVKWDTNEFIKRIGKVLQENFDNRYSIGAAKSGATGGMTELDDTIVLLDREIYMYIGFNIVGEQIMKNQIAFSIYAMYMPEFDIDLNDNYIERNKEICDKVVMLKQSQNPKINNYMQTITELIISELENWMNVQNENSLYD